MHGLSSAEFAAKLKTSVKHVNYMEGYQTQNVPVKNIERVAEAFNITPQSLLLCCLNIEVLKDPTLSVSEVTQLNKIFGRVMDRVNGIAREYRRGNTGKNK